MTARRKPLKVIPSRLCHLAGEPGSGVRALCGQATGVLHFGGTKVCDCIECLRAAAHFGYELREDVLNRGGFPRIEAVLRKMSLWVDG